jgi:hypothetical protein
MSATAPFLPFATRTQSADEDAVILTAFLQHARKWMTRIEMQALPVFAGWDDRRFRRAAEFANGVILGGNKGYCLWRYASNDETDRVENALRKQARKLLRKVIQIRKVRNGAAPRPLDA